MTMNVTISAANEITSVITRALGGLPCTTPRNVFGTKSRAILPPGERFSYRPVPTLIDGRTDVRYAHTHCGAATSQILRPPATTAASTGPRHAHPTRIPPYTPS